MSSEKRFKVGQRHTEHVDTMERHRHRFEFNNEYLAEFEKAGMKAVGINPDSNLVEIIEIPSHQMVHRSSVPSRISKHSYEATSIICRFYTCRFRKFKIKYRLSLHRFFCSQNLLIMS